MQKIAIFGGSGMTGQCVVRHALQKDLKIRLLIRDEATLPEEFKNVDKIELIKGNVLDLSNVKTAIKDVDAVCVVLGTRNNVSPTTDMSNGMKNVIEAMKESGIKKVSVCLSSFLFMEPEKVPKVFWEINADHKRMLDAVKDSGLEYRAVFPPHIADEPSGEFKITHDKSPGGRTISKLDLAKFLIDCLEQEEHSGKICGIATVK